MHSNSTQTCLQQKNRRTKVDGASKDLLDMMMNTDNNSLEQAKIVDSETLVSQTQDRLWRTQTSFSMRCIAEPGQEFLLNHVSKTPSCDNVPTSWVN